MARPSAKAEAGPWVLYGPNAVTQTGHILRLSHSSATGIASRHMTTVTPTGARHEVGAGELFFSTTDGRGVIDQANSVFVRLSRYSQQELIGAPHNLIRHPDMPGAAFLVMWDTLAKGQPFCAYVDNLAADGSTYTVFATITPMRDGYLSVRSRPSYEPLNSAAHAIYRATRPIELQARSDGASAHDAAVAGVGEVVRLLGEAGFSSYEDLTLASLPLEVELLPEPPERPESHLEGPLAEKLSVSNRLGAELASWAERMTGLAAVASQLTEGVAQIEATITENRNTASRIQEAEQKTQFSTSVIYLRVWADISSILEPLLQGLVERMAKLRRSCAQTQFQIALALLHNRAVNQFIWEGFDLGGELEEHRIALASLTEVLGSDIEGAAAHADENGASAAVAAATIAQLAELLTMPQMMINTWLGKSAAELTDQSLVEAMRVQSERTTADTLLMTKLAEQCRSIAVPLDAELASQYASQLGN